MANVLKEGKGVRLNPDYSWTGGACGLRGTVLGFRPRLLGMDGGPPFPPAVLIGHREVRGVEFWERQPVGRAGGVKPRTAWLTAW